MTAFKCSLSKAGPTTGNTCTMPDISKKTAKILELCRIGMNCLYKTPGRDPAALLSSTACPQRVHCQKILHRA